MFHSLRKLTDVIEIIMNFNVIRVDKPAHILFRVIVRVLDLNQAAVGNPEQVVVFGVNEADTLLRTLQMAVQPFLFVAMAVQVILAFVRIQAHQEGVMLRINPDTKLSAVLILEGAADLIAEIRHIASLVEESALLAEIVNHRIELSLEFVRVVVGSKFVPSMKEPSVA